MPARNSPELFVVDGSNIATEGRSQPSLVQLNEAVLAFMDEHPKAAITVVVDATFGHRIAKKEVKAFDEAVANNELVTPPAGAIGRGDAFVLSIANKARAGILSNDSFQEFHGDYEWLFDEGRLIGGKPVPHVGWVFVNRTPVRGPKSRRSVKDAKDVESGDKTDAKQQANRRVRAKSSESTDEAPKRSGRRQRSTGKNTDEPKAAASEETASPTAPSAASAPRDHVNELMPFLDFVEHHPVGTSCTAQVESYASHGAYARTGDVLIYIPLRLMDDPPPRSARSALKVGDAVAVVIVGFTPDRRSIDAALPHMAGDVALVADAATSAATEPEKSSRTKKSAGRKAAAKKTAAKKTTAKKSAPAEKAAAKKAAAKKTTAKKTTAKKAPAKKSAAKKTAARKTAAKKAAPKKAASRKTTAAKAPGEKAAAKKAPARGRRSTSAPDGADS